MSYWGNIMFQNKTFINNKKFWENYNDYISQQIEELLIKKKQIEEEFVICDFHIHSNHSSDGKQSLNDIINESIKHNLEIIAITDHDSVSVYDELYEMLKSNSLPKEAPIIIPGIEHTVSYKEYKTMCHILKYFINPKSLKILKDISTLNKSYYNRAKIQISRILESTFYQELFEKYKITISYKDFINYLNERNVLPDYAPLVDYLAIKFDNAKLRTDELYKLVKQYNDNDKCLERKKIKNARFAYIDKKYKGMEVQGNRRFMLSILGVRGVDDAYFPNYDISGSLSVDDYGQVSIYNLNNEGVTVFAHPEHEKVHLIKNIKHCAGGFWGIELNFKSKQEFFNELIEVANQEHLYLTKGSDKHNVDEPAYEDLSYYKIPIQVLDEMVKARKK